MAIKLIIYMNYISYNSNKLLLKIKITIKKAVSKLLIFSASLSSFVSKQVKKRSFVGLNVTTILKRILRDTSILTATNMGVLYKSKAKIFFVFTSSLEQNVKYPKIATQKQTKVSSKVYTFKTPLKLSKVFLFNY